MAQTVSTDSVLLSIYKTWYTEKEFPNLLFRNSPLLKVIEKNRIQGKEYRMAAMYSRGGATSGDYTVAVAGATSGNMGANAEFVVTPGNLFTVFTITQKEILASQSKQGAYVKSLINRMFAATEGSRKLLAASLFGWGYGDVGQLPTAVLAAATSMTLNWDAVVKLDIGMTFFVVNGSSLTYPGGAAFYDTTARTITQINMQTITWSGGGVTAGGWAAGSWILINGGQDNTSGGGNPNMPTGLQAWLPSYAQRGGQTASPTWASLAATSFYGVNRSISQGALAGWYYQRPQGQTYSDALVMGVKMARRGGGVPNKIVVNDEDFALIMNEYHQNMTYFQMTNSMPEKTQTNDVARGLSEFRAMFSTSFIQNLWEDPYCPQGTAYILDMEALEFVALNNLSATNDGVPANEPGSQTVEKAGEPDTTFKLLIDDYINVAPNSSSSQGPAAQISLSFYGNFALHAPGHCAVVQF